MMRGVQPSLLMRDGHNRPVDMVALHVATPLHAYLDVLAPVTSSPFGQRSSAASYANNPLGNMSSLMALLGNGSPQNAVQMMFSLIALLWAMRQMQNMNGGQPSGRSSSPNGGYPGGQDDYARTSAPSGRAPFHGSQDPDGTVKAGSLANPGFNPTAPDADMSGVGGRVIESQGTKASIRRQPITPYLKAQLTYAGRATGLDAEVTSGGQPAFGPARTGSHRHDHGNAADLVLRDARTGRMLDMRSPEDAARMSQFTEAAVRAGATGVGAGPGYMGYNTVHIGGGTPATWGGANWIGGALERGMARGQMSPQELQARLQTMSRDPQMVASRTQQPDEVSPSFRRQVQLEQPPLGGDTKDTTG